MQEPDWDNPDSVWDWQMNYNSHFRHLNEVRRGFVEKGDYETASLIEWWQWEVVRLHTRIHEGKS